MLRRFSLSALLIIGFASSSAFADTGGTGGIQGHLWIELIPTVSNVASAFAALVTALILQRQIREDHKSASVQVFYQLSNKFYDTDLMRALRRRAAFELTSKNTQAFPAFDEVGSFFDFVGTLVKRKALDPEMVTHEFRRRALAFWYKAREIEAIENMNKIHKTRWDNYRDLVNTMEQTYARIYKIPDGRLSSDEVEDMLKREMALQTIKDEQQRLP